MLRLIFIALTALSFCSCSNPDSLPNRIQRKVERDTVKVSQKTENIIERTEEKIQRTGRKVERKVQHAGEVIEGND